MNMPTRILASNKWGTTVDQIGVLLDYLVSSRRSRGRICSVYACMARFATPPCLQLVRQICRASHNLHLVSSKTGGFREQLMCSTEKLEDKSSLGVASVCRI